MTSLDADLLWAELKQLARRPSRREVAGDGLAVSDHAVQRYRERVERIPRARARRRLHELAADAVWEDLPRGWTTLILHRDTRYGYPERRTDVCLLERDGYVVTVLSQHFLRRRWRV